jgi:phosphoribosylamine--glycine ligase
MGEMKGMKLVVKANYAICVVIAAKGYPDSYSKGDPIELPTCLPDGVSIIHAGTARDDEGRLITAGGRVMGVAALDSTLQGAADKAYAVCSEIRCATKYYRKDIGARQLTRR